MLEKIISGGQTGVDRAALDAAMAAGVDVGGWCPPGREAEDGLIPLNYPLKETPTNASPDAPGIPRSLRTEWNVRDSDATIIISTGRSAYEDPGTKWTIDCATKFGKPLLKVDPEGIDSAKIIRSWIFENSIKVLNVAGPPESMKPGIYHKTFLLLSNLFKMVYY